MTPSMIKEAAEAMETLKRHQAEVNKAEGMLEAATLRLKELGFNSVEEAEEHLAKLGNELETAETNLFEALKEFNEQFA